MKLVKTKDNPETNDNPDRAAEYNSDPAWNDQHPEVMKGEGLANENREANQRLYNFANTPPPASRTESRIIPGRTLGDVAAEKKSEAAWDRLEAASDGKVTKIQEIAKTVGGLAVGNPPTEEVQIQPDGSEKITQTH